MLFKCKNCGGNVVFEPSRQKMYCPHCEGEDSENLVTGGSAAQCLNCGAPLELPEDASAARCSHCGSYLIFDERVEGALRPNLVLPFRLNKEQAVAKLNQEFSNRVFTPSDFISTKSLEQMEGDYVPFWLYDFQAQYDFVGEGTRVRTWRSGNTEYVETSYYEVVRRMDADFDKVPVDASYQMDDSVMDLMEPYDYQALENFDPKFMSGFYAQIYNQPPQELEGRGQRQGRARLRGAAAAVFERLRNHAPPAQKSEPAAQGRVLCAAAGVEIPIPLSESGLPVLCQRTDRQGDRRIAGITPQSAAL